MGLIENEVGVIHGRRWRFVSWAEAMELEWAKRGLMEMERMTKVGVDARKALNPRAVEQEDCLLYTSPSPRDLSTSRMPSSA